MVVVRAYTIRGSYIEDDVPEYFQPGWGMARGSYPLICFHLGQSDKHVYRIGKVGDTLVLEPSDDEPEQELVLIQAYRTGCGAKRFPSFSVDTDGLNTFVSVSTSGGSGGEEWSLVLAPLGFSENITSQFIDERDVEDQVIRHRVCFAI